MPCTHCASDEKTGFRDLARHNKLAPPCRGPFSRGVIFPAPRGAGTGNRQAHGATFLREKVSRRGPGKKGNLSTPKPLLWLEENDWFRVRAPLQRGERRAEIQKCSFPPVLCRFSAGFGSQTAKWTKANPLLVKNNFPGKYSNRPAVRSKWVPRQDFCDNLILSEQVYPSAKTFWNSNRRRSPNRGPQGRR